MFNERLNMPEITQLQTFDTEIIQTEAFDTHVENLHRQRNILEEMLNHQRSFNTRISYETDIKEFFKFFGCLPSPEAIQKFLSLTKLEATAFVLKWKHALVTRGLKESTISRKIGSVKALVKFSNDMGVCFWTLTAESLICKRVQRYRDTSGVPPVEVKKILAFPDRNSFRGKRDFAMLQLLWGNGLRRAEVIKIDIEDLDLSDRSLWILGKGKSEKIKVIVNKSTADALRDWVVARIDREGDFTGPLFISVGGTTRGKRLSAQSLYGLVDRASKAAGITKKMSPHRIRHSAITEVLKRNGGNIQAAQSFSRHADPKTLMVYDDNRLQPQAKMSELLEL